MKGQYSKRLDEFVKKLKVEGRVPSILLHSCCAPCSSYCIEFLAEYFDVTVFYYNPNIYPDEEYLMRVRQQQDFINRFPAARPVSFIEGEFEKDRFYDEVARGYEDCPERGERCERCFFLRLSETAKRAAADGFEYFATTLTISPQKDVDVLNEVGQRCARLYGVSYLETEFRKKGGYLRSCEISREYDMYRQDYCGCVYSKQERDRQRQENEKESGRKQ